MAWAFATQPVSNRIYIPEPLTVSSEANTGVSRWFGLTTAEKVVVNVLDEHRRYPLSIGESNYGSTVSVYDPSSAAVVAGEFPKQKNNFSPSEQYWDLFCYAKFDPCSFLS